MKKRRRAPALSDLIHEPTASNCVAPSLERNAWPSATSGAVTM
jgi:hypothetical protein